jgi:hypothetical protein
VISDWWIALGIGVCAGAGSVVALLCVAVGMVAWVNDDLQPTLTPPAPEPQPPSARPPADGA